MARLLNMARMGSTTTGTGSNIALTSSVIGFITFAAAGAVDGDLLYCAIEDGPASREVGVYTYNATGPTLSNRTVIKSTNSNNPINLSGTAQVFSSVLVESFIDQQLLQVNSNSNVNYTLALTDANDTILFTAASAISVTVPPNASVPFQIGTQIMPVRYGAGSLTFVQGAGVTLRKPASKSLSIAEQYGSAVLQKLALNEWLVAGYLT